MREALYYTGAAKGAACCLCPHRCIIGEGERGRCGARGYKGGVLLSESYGQVTALALDPIEKKPLGRFFPGSRILSVGSYGCNLHCPFCQNHEISLGRPESREMTPQMLARLSLAKGEQGNIGLAYTYNEPLVGFEFVLDCARLIRAQGQKNVLVTNGFIQQGPLLELLPFIDALNIDLKGIEPAYYRSLGGSLSDVQRTIRLAAEGCHVELTTLIVPGRNDNAEEMKWLAGWIAEVNPAIPLHISRYFPRYRMTEPATPVETIYHLAETARGYLHHVYEGNC